MASIILFKSQDGAPTVKLDGIVDATTFTAEELVIDGQTLQLAVSQEIDREWILQSQGGAADEFVFAVPTPSLGIELEFEVVWTNTATLFDLKFDFVRGVSATLYVRIPADGQKSTAAPVALLVCGHCEANAPGVYAAARMCFSIMIDRIDHGNNPALIPFASVILPDIGIRLPQLRIPWSIGNPLRPFASPFPAMSFDCPPLRGRISWRALIVEVTPADATVEFVGLTVAVGPKSIEANVKLKWSNGTVTIVELKFIRPSIVLPAPLPEWKFDDRCLIIAGGQSELVAIIQYLAPELDAFTNLNSPFNWAMRIFFADEGFEEVRFDITPSSVANTAMPGFKITVAANATLHLVFRKPANELQALWLGSTLRGGTYIELSIPFNLGRNDFRELMPGEDDSKRLKLTLTPTSEVTVAVAKFDQAGTSEFLKKTPQPLEALDINHVPLTCQATPDPDAELGAGDVTITPDFSALADLALPFLQDKLAAIQQFVEIVSMTALPYIPASPTIEADVKLKVKIGEGALELLGDVKLIFNLQRFSIEVDHGDGIEFKLPDPPQDKELFGLKWTFEPSPGDFDFVLNTQDSNYQIKQAPGSRFILGFDRATSSDSPIQFIVENFSLGEKGISLDGHVAQTPAKLAALDTEFTFTEGILQIRDNQIAGFTIGGSGDIPPDLVGPAKASIRLQFEQDATSRSLKLTSADARIESNSLLECESTRFQFALTALGLKFVESDGRYHLYFTLSGTAKFVLQGGDAPDGPLGWLPAIEMQMVECPLTSDISVLAEHVNFLVPLPKPETFPFLGCFEFELRAIGFAPKDPVFRDPKPAMLLSGQVRFSAGDDAVDARVDFHMLHIGLPADGKVFPQFYLKGLGIKLAVGSAFELGGSVEFIDEGTDLGGGVTGEGFSGRGEMQISGLPRITAGFAFLRVKRNPEDNPVRSWFLYLEASRLSAEIPVIKVYLREIGIGFGYRMTLPMIKSADEVDDPKQLLKVLKEQAKRAGELSQFQAWRVDMEEPGEDPRWTVALRAMISQSSAAGTPTDWNPKKEERLPCLFLLDAVAAIRSDLTFLMVARAWFLTNYFDFTMERPRALREQPLLTGFVLLSPRKKRLLANLSSNPDAVFGEHSPVTNIFKKAIENTRFSATLLIEPGLVHYELGWPNQLRWEEDFCFLKLQLCGGMIYRLSKKEFVIGQSFLARGTLQFSAGVNMGCVGASLSATATVAYGARYIGVLSFERTQELSAFYGGAGIEINVDVSVSFWIEIDAFVGTITLDYSFSFSINFTASVEVGILLDPKFGVRGTATVGLSIMGHDLQFAIRVAFQEDSVTKAHNLTKKFLNVGLEAGDVEPIPGVNAQRTRSRSLTAPDDLHARPNRFSTTSEGLHASRRFESEKRKRQNWLLAARNANNSRKAMDWRGGEAFETPSYRVLLARVGQFVYTILVPAAEVLTRERAQRVVDYETGFLPVPPVDIEVNNIVNDFSIDFRGGLSWTVDRNGMAAHPLEQVYSQAGSPDFGLFKVAVPSDEHKWKVDWNSTVPFTKFERNADYPVGSTPAGEAMNVPLRRWLAIAYEFGHKDGPNNIIREWEDIIPLGDPIVPVQDVRDVVDPRVRNPAEGNFEAAVRGAAEQFKATPYLKRSDGKYDYLLRQAFDHQTTLYAPDGQVAPPPAQDKTPSHVNSQQIFQQRSVIIKSMITDFQDYLALVRKSSSPANEPFASDSSLVRRMGLAFRCDLGTDVGEYDERLKEFVECLNNSTIKQRTVPSAPTPSDEEQPIRVFNPPELSFARRPPSLNDLVHLEDEGMVAIDWKLGWRKSSRDAKAKARMGAGADSDKVDSIEVFLGSRGYDDPLLPPGIVIAPPTGGAAAEVNFTIDLLNDGGLPANAVLVQEEGEGYSSMTPPTVVIEPPLVGVQAQAHVDPTKIVAGRLQSDAVVIDVPGSGYDPNSLPSVTIDLPPGKCQAKAEVIEHFYDEKTGELLANAFVIVEKGAGYTEQPGVDIDPPSKRRRSENDPNHHLDHYVIRRLCLDVKNASERVFKVKPADVLHRDKNSVVHRLKTRFHFVDLFDDETPEDVAALPPEGYRYSYTITPIDNTGIASSASPPIVIRRMPSTPPPPITESEFIVDYQIDSIPKPSADPPRMREIKRLTYCWTPPSDPKIGPKIAVSSIRLVFRKDEVLPIGQYAQDCDAGGPRSQGLATSNARPLSNDRTFEFNLSDSEIDELTDLETGLRRFFVAMSSEDGASSNFSRLISKLEGPRNGNLDWRPIGWRVFVQTKSAGNVYSALVPVTIRLRFNRNVERLSPNDVAPEERRPSTIEWIPNPVQMNILPARDLTGQPGFAMVPMPMKDKWEGGDIGAFVLHPLRRRCLSLTWNQMGTANEEVRPKPIPYPREFASSYELFEFDVDAHMAEKINEESSDPVPFHEWAKESKVRNVQRFEMLPSDMLLTSPSDTSDTGKWEAWYPSTRFRRDKQIELDQSETGKIKGSQAIYTPWYSWRESVLVWPDPMSRIAIAKVPENAAKEFERKVVDNRIHPYLQFIIDRLMDSLESQDEYQDIVATFGPTPATADSLSGFMSETSPAADPYGWSILNRLGYSVCFTLRDRLGNPVSPEAYLSLLHETATSCSAQIICDPTKISATGQLMEGSLVVENGGCYAPNAIPTITISSPADPAGTTATVSQASLRLDPTNGTLLLDAIAFDDPGSGYDPLNPPTISVTPSSMADDLKSFLFVECLYQPAKATRSAPDESIPDGDGIPKSELLGVIQLSLRPRIEQIREYRRYVFDLTELITSSDQSLYLNVEPVAGGEKLHVVVVGFNSEIPIEISDTTTLSIPKPIGTLLTVLIRSVLGTSAHAVKIATQTTSDWNDSPPADVMEAKISGGDPFLPIDSDCRYFTINIEDIVRALGPEPDRPGRWDYLRNSIEALNPRELPRAELKLEWPDASQLEAIGASPPGAEILAWLQRFFDYGASVPGDGPWVAMAYPRSLAVTAIAPNETSGLLEYRHSIEDLYAHAWRYYMRPSGRYDALWASLAQSHPLFRDEDGNVKYDTIAENVRDVSNFVPPPPSGLDLIVPRIRPVAAPMILYSGRLDAPAPVNKVQSKPPGRTWQVILAKHGEQMLSERNRTLARRLAFRQMSVSLIRRFQYEDLIPTRPTLFLLKRDLPIAGPILQPGENLALKIGSDEMRLTPSDFGGLLAELRLKLETKANVEEWVLSPNAKSAVIRSTVGGLKLIHTSAGGTSDWLEEYGLTPLYDQYTTTIELDVAGPLLAADESFELIVKLTSNSEVTLTTNAVNNNNVDGLIEWMVQHVPGMKSERIVGTTPGKCYLMLSTPAYAIQLDKIDTVSGDRLQLLKLLRPVAGTTQSMPNLPGPFADLSRHDPLSEYTITDPPEEVEELEKERKKLDELRQMNLPTRLGKFSQGAVVYQWQSLPFYYQHLFMAVAQSTDVVSPISSTLQKDFEYVSPTPNAKMEGGKDESDTRFRRILIRTENFWNCLHPEAQRCWQVDAPNTTLPSEAKPHSAVTDPQVIYQLVLSRPGGVIQILSRFFFDSTQPTRFNVKNFPIIVDGSNYAAEIVKLHHWGVDPSLPFEAYLETYLKPASADIVSRAITTRHAFDATLVTSGLTGTAELVGPNNVEHFPRSAVLTAVKSMTDVEFASLESLLLGARRDNAFRVQATRFIQRLREFRIANPTGHPDIREEVSVGIDQLRELSEDPTLVTIDEANKRILWISSDPLHLLTPSQKFILDGGVVPSGSPREGWKESAACGATVKKLLHAEETLTSTGTLDLHWWYNDTDVIPTIAAGDPLHPRLNPNVAPGELSWTLGVITAAEQTELENLRDSLALSASFRDAIRLILEVGDRFACGVQIQELDYAPRPTLQDFAANLGDKVGFCRGTISFKGAMLRTELIGIRNASISNNGDPIAVVDRAIAGHLHNDSLKAGFNGATLEIQAIRGSAPAKRTTIQPFLDVNA